MIRGTTALNIFNTNKDLRDAKVFVTYSQIGRTVIEKTNEDIIINADNIEVPLEQKDTLKLSAKYPLSIQIRYVRDNGVANAVVAYHNKLASFHNADDVLYAVVEILDEYGRIVKNYSEVVDHKENIEE